MTPYLVQLGPARLHARLARLIPSAVVRALCAIVDFMQTTSVGIIAAKKAALDSRDKVVVVRQVGRGKGVMSILRASSLPRMCALVSPISTRSSAR